MSDDELAAQVNERWRLLSRNGGRARELVGEWMAAAGLLAREDEAGNLIGRYEAAHGGALTLLLGAHCDPPPELNEVSERLLDPVGLLVALALVERLRARQLRLPFALDIVAFAGRPDAIDDRAPCPGTRAIVGTRLPGPSSRAARQTRPLWPAARRPEELLGYCAIQVDSLGEVARLGQPLAVGLGIPGRTVVRATLAGPAGTPRRAGVVAQAGSDLTAAVARVASGRSGVGVGHSRHLTSPAGDADASTRVIALQLQHCDDAQRAASEQQIHEEAAAICRAADLTLDWAVEKEWPAVSCDPRLITLLGHAALAREVTPVLLPGAAAHDAVTLAAITPVALLILRRADGLDHSPSYPGPPASAADVALAIGVLGRFLELLAGDLLRR